MRGEEGKKPGRSKEKMEVSGKKSERKGGLEV